MSDPPGRLHRKPKLLRHRRGPALQQLLAHPPPKRLIHFHGIQAPRIMLQKSPRPELRRRQSRPPARVTPHRCSCVTLSHTQPIVIAQGNVKSTISCAIAPGRSFAAARAQPVLARCLSPLQTSCPVLLPLSPSPSP